MLSNEIKFFLARRLDQEERILLAPYRAAYYWFCIRKITEEAAKGDQGDVAYWSDYARQIVELFEEENLPHPMTIRLSTSDSTNL